MKYRIILAALGLILLVISGACAPQAETVDPAAVRAAIEENNAQFEEAFNQGDAAAVAALYTEDAIAMPPGQEMASGRAAIEQGMNADLENFALSGLSLTTTDVEVSGDLAVEVGTYSIKAGDLEDNGKYVVVWKKQDDDTWKIHRDIWNSNVAPPQPEEEPQEEESDQ